ncbi:hypothetical protein HLVA_17640 [Haliovirga abyssi]|uniref:Uncharacterized protein n=2 Tax=Haliovirga abyssi TaxID=2996794 RepID=A0AAU9E3Y8_9FUSO|nr:hypothetical protein HLVA_17640 [Haliovirga abyssi]
MKYIFMIFLLSTMIACTSLEKDKSKTQIKYMPTQITIESGDKFSRIKWNLQNKNNIEKIELFRNLEYASNKYYKLKELPFDYDFTDVQQPTFAKLKYYFKITYKDGIQKKSDTFDVIGKHNSVILDNGLGIELEVILPKNYNTNKEKKYPVVYLLDGMDNFELNMSEDELMFDEMIELNKDKLSDMIVIGIESPVDRYRRFLPYKDVKNAGVANPGGVEYSKFIAEKVIPYVDKKYRTIKRADGRTIYVVSHGGLLSNYIGETYPKLFKNSASLSPAFYVGDFAEIEKIKNNKKTDKKVYIFTGTNEWQMNGRMAVKAYENIGYKYGKDIIYYEGNDEYHHVDSWRKIEMDPLLFFENGTDDNGEFRIEIERIYGFGVEPRPYGTPESYKPGRVTTIINPVFTTKRGIQYSLMDLAKYEVIDKENGKINKYGEFKFLNNLPCRVKVTYSNVEKIVEVLPYKKTKIIKNTSIKIDSLNWNINNGKIILNWKLNRYESSNRIEVWAKQREKDKFKYIGYQPAYLEKFDTKLDFDKKYELKIRLIGENEKVIEEKIIK